MEEGLGSVTWLCCSAPARRRARSRARQDARRFEHRVYFDRFIFVWRRGGEERGRWWWFFKQGNFLCAADLCRPSSSSRENCANTASLHPSPVVSPFFLSILEPCGDRKSQLHAHLYRLNRIPFLFLKRGVAQTCFTPTAPSLPPFHRCHIAHLEKAPHADTFTRQAERGARDLRGRTRSCAEGRPEGAEM